MITLSGGRAGAGCSWPSPTPGRGCRRTCKAQLFTPFFTTREQGQGIGLVMVQEILLAHGFDFELRNREAAGAEFGIYSEPGYHEGDSREKCDRTASAARVRPVALVGSDRCPDDAVRYKSGRFGCVLDLFATASRQGRVAAASRESLACAGGRAALGLGVDFAESAQQLDRYAALFSKGLRSTRHPEAYRAHMDKVPHNGAPCTSSASAVIATRSWPANGCCRVCPTATCRTATSCSSLLIYPMRPITCMQ